MSEPTKAVFLSYASQDSDAARHIADALRAVGVEVWFDADGGLEHGDEWDAKIRRQIKECVLFIPVISASTQARHEGYFRIEWDMAAERARGIASGVPFILPVVIDDTREPEALVPDRFRAVQWTRLPRGVVPPEVQARFLKLWSHRTGVLSHQAALASGHGKVPTEVRREKKPAGKAYALAAVVLIMVMAALGWRFFPGRMGPAGAASEVAGNRASQEADQLVARALGLFDKMNYTRDNLAAAEDLLHKATDMASDSARVWAARAYTQSCFILRGWDVSEKRRQDTQTFANRALSLGTNEPDALLALAVVYNEQGAYAQAEAMARRAVALRPDNARARMALAAAISAQGRTEETLAMQEETARLFPREPLAFYALSNTHLRLGQFAETLANIEAALAVQPFSSALLAKVRLLAGWKGDLAGARAALDQLAPEERTEDRAVGVALWLGLLERNLAHVQAAAALTTRNYFFDNVITATGPKAASVALAYHLAGKVALARQQWQAAELAVRQWMREHPDDTAASARLATILVWLGRNDEAAREIAPFEAAAHEQRGLDAGLLLAQYYASLGDAGRAVPFLREILNRRPENADRTLPLDPWWDKLRGQPEFEALLAEAAGGRPTGQARGKQGTGKQATVDSGQGTVKGGPAFDPEPSRESSKSIGMADAKSVAVLAFANLSDDKDNEYFSDGISEELLNVLAKVPGLKVSARTSAFYFKGKQVQIADIAQQLGVAYVVEGSVRKVGNRVRITAQLIKAADGFHVWSENFDRELKDIFAVQDEIAGLIAKNLSLRMEAGAAKPAGMTNAEAYELFLQGRAAWRLRNQAGYDRAEALFNRALQLQPDFARAHVGLADVWMNRAQDEEHVGAFGQRHTAALARMAASIESALSFDPALADAHSSLGTVRWMEWKFDESVRALRLALALNPNDASSHQRLGRTLLVNGQIDEALAELKRAHELDPLFARIADNYSLALAAAGRHQEALLMAERALELQPGSRQALRLRAVALAELGRGDEVPPAARKYLANGVDNAPYLVSYALARVGARREAEEFLRGLTDLEREPQKGAALIALGRGDEWLNRLRAEQVNILEMETMLYWPVFDSVRTDPRFVTLLRTLGLSEVHDRAQAWRAANQTTEDRSQATGKKGMAK